MGVNWRIIRPFDPWKSPLCTCPIKWTVNPYTGCGHGCLYCYASSYIKNFFDPRPKENLLVEARKDLLRIPRGSVIELSASSDPLQPLEDKYGLTYKIAQEILSRGFKILFTTKAPNKLLKYRDLLEKYRGRIAVAATITTLRSDLASILEPNAPLPHERLWGIEELAKLGIPVTVRVDPVIPLINDDPDELKRLIKEVARRGVRQITTSTYKVKPDNFKRIVSAFPNLRERLYELYYVEGEFMYGYRYLPKKLRLDLMKMIREYTLDEGLEFATCREGFVELHTKGTICDGSGYIRGGD
ncbi:MAG: SPL family radical SAM protein [Sulfolobales archaeon]